MPLFYQQDINEETKLGLWKIEESADFFLSKVPVSRDITHPHKRLQHLAGRYLLQELFPEFPMALIEIADTRKPYLPNESHHFSISHCHHWVAALVSTKDRVGVDVEAPDPKIRKLINKFLHPDELGLLVQEKIEVSATLLWSAKESMFKWYGEGGIDFREHLRLLPFDFGASGAIPARFKKTDQSRNLTVYFQFMESIWLSYVVDAGK